MPQVGPKKIKEKFFLRFQLRILKSRFFPFLVHKPLTKARDKYSEVDGEQLRSRASDCLSGGL